MRLAVVGKGGSGKSFISATLARSLAQQGRTVALLDADALPGAAISLGMGPITNAMLNEAAFETIDGWRLNPGVGAATAVKRYSAVGPDGVRLLQYGKAGDNGLTGMWGSVHAFRLVSQRLARDGVLASWDIIGDLAAGSRQSAQNSAPYADTHLVVIGRSAASRLTGRRLLRMAAQRGKRALVVLNGVDSGDELDGEGADVVAVIPRDAAVHEADRQGLAPIDTAPDSPAVSAVRSLAAELIAEERVAS